MLTHRETFLRDYIDRYREYNATRKPSEYAAGIEAALAAVREVLINEARLDDGGMDETAAKWQATLDAEPRDPTEIADEAAREADEELRREVAP